MDREGRVGREGRAGEHTHAHAHIHMLLKLPISSVCTFTLERQKKLSIFAKRPRSSRPELERWKEKI